MTGPVRQRPLWLLVSLIALVGPGLASAQVPARDDSVRVRCSGGETGAGTGNTLTRSGQLSAYVKPLREAATQTSLRRNSATAAAVFAALERIRFRMLRFNEIGNMTCVLELVDGEGEHEVNWILGRPPARLEPVLAALRSAFDDRRMWP